MTGGWEVRPAKLLRFMLLKKEYLGEKLLARMKGSRGWCGEGRALALFHFYFCTVR